jgi:hypothetical protein
VYHLPPQRLAMLLDESKDSVLVQATDVVKSIDELIKRNFARVISVHHVENVGNVRLLDL